MILTDSTYKPVIASAAPTPRKYQAEAIRAGVEFFQDKKQYNALEILPTGSGKSVVIANIAKECSGKTVVFQPSKEILQQNFNKFLSYGYRAGIYSESAGMKFIDDITFATIGSVTKKAHLFEQFKNIIVDECHQVNPKEGMYHRFIHALGNAKVLGLTATPYRLASGAGGAELRFLNRTSPRIFNKVLYYVQNDVLFNAGHLAPLEYYSFNVVDRTMLSMNASGTDFTEASVRSYNRHINLTGRTIEYANRILAKRRNLLVFCKTVAEAWEIAAGIPGAKVVSGDTPPTERAIILKQFKAGVIPCIVNVKVLDTGFDFPGLEAVLMSISTMSLAVYYQIAGRVMRPFQYPDGSWKTGWVVDMGGNIDFFGKIETMRVQQNEKGLYSIWNNGRQLTNVAFSKN